MKRIEFEDAIIDYLKGSKYRLINTPPKTNLIQVEKFYEDFSYIASMVIQNNEYEKDYRYLCWRTEKFDDLFSDYSLKQVIKKLEEIHIR